MGFSMPPHPLTNLELQRYYQNEPRFNGVFSINNPPKKIKDGHMPSTLVNIVALFCNENEIV